MDELQRKFGALLALQDDAEYGGRLRSALVQALALIDLGADDRARGLALGMVGAERARLLIAVARARGSAFRVRDMPVGQMLAGVRALGRAKLLGSDPDESDKILRELEDALARHADEPPAAGGPPL